MSAARHLPILLLEPSALLRQTVALTAISIGAGSVWQASNTRTAQEMLKTQRFAGVVVAIDARDDCDDDALSMIESIRAGKLASPADIPVYLLVDSCSESLLARLSPLNIQRILIKPFKARVLIETLSSIFSSSAKGGAVDPIAC